MQYSAFFCIMIPSVLGVIGVLRLLIYSSVYPSICSYSGPDTAGGIRCSKKTTNRIANYAGRSNHPSAHHGSEETLTIGRSRILSSQVLLEREREKWYPHSPLSFSLSSARRTYRVGLSIRSRVVLQWIKGRSTFASFARYSRPSSFAIIKLRLTTQFLSDASCYSPERQLVPARCIRGVRKLFTIWPDTNVTKWWSDKKTNT